MKSKKKFIKKVSLIVITTMVIFFLLNCSTELEENEIINSSLSRDSLEKLNSSVGIDWQVKSVTDLTLSKRWGGGWDSIDIADPCIIKMGESDYRMWYSGKGPYGESVGIWRIGYAISKDGKSWSKDFVNNAVLVPNQGAEDKDGVRVLSVIYDSEEKLYKMWYRGFNGSSINIFYATSKFPNRGWIKYPNDEFSPDGKPEPVITIDKLSLGSQDMTCSGVVIKDIHYITPQMKKSNYNLWLVLKSDDGYRIMYRYSANGMKWFEDLGALPVIPKRTGFFKDGMVAPAVIKDYLGEQPVYKMWFVGLELAPDNSYMRQIGLAYCFNYGARFSYMEKGEKPPAVFAPGELEEDKGSIEGLNVLRDKNRYKMWYIGRDATGTPRICYRESINY